MGVYLQCNSVYGKFDPPMRTTGVRSIIPIHVCMVFVLLHTGALAHWAKYVTLFRILFLEFQFQILTILDVLNFYGYIRVFYR